MTRLLVWLIAFGFAGLAAATSPPWCHLYLKRLAGVLAQEPALSWPSRFLSSRPLSTLPPEQARRRVREIAEGIYSNGAFGTEFDNYFIKRVSSTGWLSDYFRSYEVFYWSPLYQEVVARAHERLPQVSRILDVGSSTGGMGGFLAEGSPFRAVTSLDSPEAMALAKRRMEGIFPGQGRFGFAPFYLRAKGGLPPEVQFDSAVVNHVLYTMLPATKGNALTSLHERLPPGATVVINEPVKEVAGEGDRHRQWLTEVIESAVVAGAPHTEFDVAMILAVASGRATKSMRMDAPLELPLLTREQHEALFKEKGFEVVSSEPTYDGFSRMWTLRRR